MTKKIRYLLICAGFAIFLLLAPITFLYLNGVTFDFSSRKFVQTGILSVASEPKTLNISLNGGLAAKSAGNIRFLKPGEYNVQLQKEGFFDWTKRLAIKAGEVTQAAQRSAKIFLLRKPPLLSNIDPSVIDFTSKAGTLAYLAQSQLIIAPLDGLEQKEKYPLPKPANGVQLSSDGGVVLLTQPPQASNAAPTILTFNRASSKFTDISALFSQPADIKFSNDNGLYVLENQILYQVDVQRPAKTALLNNVSAFAFQGNNLYYIQKNGEFQELMAAQPPFAEGLPLLINLPSFKKAEIIVSSKKTAFLLLDNALYQISASLEPISENVSEWNFDAKEISIIYQHGGEISFSDPVRDNFNFITRSSLPLKNPALNLTVGYAFVFKDKTLVAIELDTRDHQNEYPLYVASQPKKFLVDPEAKNILVLDGEMLENLQIR
jgi:hypothetical protein